MLILMCFSLSSFISSLQLYYVSTRSHDTCIRYSFFGVTIPYIVKSLHPIALSAISPTSATLVHSCRNLFNVKLSEMKILHRCYQKQINMSKLLVTIPRLGLCG